MRLVAVLRNDVPWMTVEIRASLAPVATVEHFYADVSGSLDRARAAAHADPTLDAAPRTPPIPIGAKVLCAGLNYSEHIAETNSDRPERPDLFARWASTLVAPHQPVPVPFGEPGLDWEAELAAVVGTTLHRATADEVEAGMLGYTCFNDLSARVHQRATRQWALGKNADCSGPIGPVIVTRDEIAEPYGLRIQTRVDGVVMQDSTTAHMMFRIGEIGAYASEVMTLRPGDVISTGTPSGVGAARRPQVFLTSGQIVDVEIDGIGVLSTPIA